MRVDNVTIKLAEDMLKAYVNPELKKAAEDFIASPDDNTVSMLATKLYEGIATIDEALGFAKSDYCKEKFGEEAAKAMLAETEKRKANGEKYCNCEGCTKALALLNALAD